jgi:cobalt-zinc-cadmium efflux system outer membrane protein
MLPSHVSGAIFAAIAIAGSGCASRDVPVAYAKTSAASPTAAEAPAVVVARALQTDPPLPGTDSEGWSGLAPDVRTILGKPLDADAAVRIALLDNRELRARLAELGVARARVLEAGLVANPVFEVELLPERDSDMELRLEYEITSLILAPMKRRAEQHELEAARLEAAGAVVELGYGVRTAFYALQTAEQRLAFAQQTLDALAAGRDAAQALVDAGNIRQLDAATQVVGYERARITVAQVELEVASLREALHRLLGLHGEDTRWSVAPGLRPVPEQLPAMDGLESRVLAANLDLRAADKRLEALARRTGIARTEGWLPEVAMDVHSLRTDSETDGDSEWRWGGGVSVEVPLFDHGQGERRGYEAEFDALRERYQGLAIDLRSSARDASNRLRSAHARARQYEHVILPAQQTVLEQTLLQYNAMQIGVFQLLEARRELLSVQLAYADTLREYWSDQARFEALLSGRMVGAAALEGSSQLAAGYGSKGGH